MAVRELLIGMALGPCLGIIALLAALGMGRSLPEALVVSSTVFFVVVMGTVTGAVLPLLFKRLGMDPALMSNPLIAAIIDVLGVVTYYTVAMVSLEHLAANGG
jgi:magnesium transporter